MVEELHIRQVGSGEADINTIPSIVLHDDVIHLEVAVAEDGQAISHVVVDRYSRPTLATIETSHRVLVKLDARPLIVQDLHRQWRIGCGALERIFTWATFSYPTVNKRVKCDFARRS